MEGDRPQFKLILGSSSIARRKILEDMGYPFTLMSADIDEKSIRKEKPEELVMALAEAKADAIVPKLQTTDCKEARATVLIAADTGLQGDALLRILKNNTASNIDYNLVHVKDYSFTSAEATMQRVHADDNIKEAEPTLLITCDQVVVYEGAIREKPSSVEEAREYIRGYSNGHAATVSSVLVTNLKTGFRKGDVDRVEIYFHEIPEAIIEKLIEEGMVLKVAGALIIEHPLILPYVKEVVGTTCSVMGLPKALTEKLLKEVL